MAYRKVNDTSLASVADAIRAKGGTSDALVFPDGFVSAISAIQTGGGGGGGGQAFQCGTVVSADGTNLVVPCTLDNILIVRNFPPTTKYTAYLLNATGLLSLGINIQMASRSTNTVANIGDGTFSIAKENGQTTFTQQTKETKFSDEYCYIAWDNAE